MAAPRNENLRDGAATPYCGRINRKLRRVFGGRVSASEARGCLVLSGRLERWDDVVRAGLLAVSKRRYHGLVNDIVCTGEHCPPMRVPQGTDSTLDGHAPDVLIIGGGVIGCAIARELSRYELRTLLVEKEHDVALHSSSRNDGMVHPGIDLKPGEIKRRYNLRGNRMYDKLCEDLDLPFRRCGQYLCFNKPWLLPAVIFTPLVFRALGLRCRFVSRRKLFLAEPQTSRKLVGALFFPDAGVVSPYQLTIALAESAIDNGAAFSLDTAVLDMEVADSRIASVHTNRGVIKPHVVINAAGVFSEDIAKMAGDHFFSIHPRRGTNAILDKKASRMLNSIVSSFGTVAKKTQHSKGGGLIRTVEGNLLCGPDAVETIEKENYATRPESIARNFERQRLASPLLMERDIITYFTGVRAAAYEEDFVITKGVFTDNIVHAAGIQSPGLTAAPAIAEDVAHMAVELLNKTGRSVAANPAFSPRRNGIVSARELSDDARNTLIRANPDYGEIVCRCEEISRGEILAALRRSLPCDTIDGVKRRVRPGMGRCQGAFCGPQVLRIIAEERRLPLDAVQKSGQGSELLLAEVKA